jgi:ubiquinone/menaquinone biosynthesis C-methylase UbiE
MSHRAGGSQEGVLEPELTYFGLQAYLGTTKHLGGLRATRELIELCHIGRDSFVLDVGCGVGATPCHLVKRYGCRVVGVDISAGMIARARERAEREGIEDRVGFRVADAKCLPFENALFDVVMCESVLVFIAAKQSALSECLRVAKPGGYVGLNELAWLKAPPPEMAEYARRTWELNAAIPAAEGWVRMLEDAGLRDIVARRLEMNVVRESSRLRRYGVQDLWEMLRRTISLYLKSSAFRRYMGERRRPPRDLFRYLGYGVYVGRAGLRRGWHETYLPEDTARST